MAIGRLKHFLVLGILCSPIFAQLIEGRDVTSSTDDTEPRNDFDIFSICPGNFSTCLNGFNCTPYIARSGRCVACKCPWHYSESDIFGQKKEVQLGQLKVHIGAMLNNKWSDIMPDLVDLPNKEFPLLVHNITGNMTDEEDRDLPDLMSQVGEFAKKPIAMPVVVAQRYGAPEPKKDSNNVTAYPGVLHLPFRVNSTKSRPIPAMYFPYCPLGESGGYDGMDGASWGKMTKKNEAMYQLHRLLFAREVTEKIGEIVSSVWPEIANFTIDCDYHYSSTKYSSILTASNMTALFNITKQFTVWSINGTTGLDDILGAVRRLHNPNNTYAKMLVDLVENLTTALDGVDDETKMKNLEFMDKSTLYKVVKNTEAIRSLFRNDTMNGGIQKFLNALLVFNKTQETSIMDHNNRMVSKLIIIAKKYSNATNGITPKFDHIVDYLNNMDGGPRGIHNDTISKFRELVQKLLQAGNDLHDSSRRRQIESIVNEGLENAAYSFAGIFYERADETVKDFLNDIYNLHEDETFTTPSINQKTTPIIIHGNMEVDNVLIAVMMFSDASSGESRFDLILNYLNKSTVTASEHVSTIQNFRIYVQKLSKVGEETTDKEKRQEIERIINDGLAVAVESFAKIFDDLPYGKAHTEVQNLLGRLGKTSMQFPPANQDGESDDGIFKGSKEEDNIHDRSRRSIGKEGKQVHSHSALNHTSVDQLKNWVYNKTSQDENPSVAYDGDNYFDNIMKSLNYSMQRANETNKKIVENLMDALSEFQADSGMNMTKLMAIIKRFKEIQDGLLKDKNYSFVTGFLSGIYSHVYSYGENDSNADDEDYGYYEIHSLDYFDNIMVSLNYSMTGANETTKEIVKNLMDVLREIQPLDSLNWMNMKKLVASVMRYMEIQDWLPKDDNYSFVTGLISEIYRYNENYSFDYDDYDYHDTPRPLYHFKNIIEALNYSMKGANSATKEIVQNLMGVITEIQTSGSLMKMNVTKVMTIVDKFEEIQKWLPKDANYTFVTEFIHEVHAHGSNMQHGSYQVQVSTGRNLHCILMELSQHIHNRSFNQLMGGIAKHFCNGTDVEENSKNDSMQHRVNETLKLVKMYNNTLKRNESLRGMLEKWKNAYGNTSYYYDVEIIKGILANLTKISEIREPENRKNEISKFWERMPRIDPNFFVGSNHLSQWRFPHIDNFMKKFSRLIPAPNHGLNVSRRVLCELAKNLTMYANSSESFADVVSDLFRLPRPMPGEDGHKREIEKIGDFIKRFNVNLPENMTHQQFADLVTETGEESEFRYRSYEKFMSNITKLAEYFPYQNKTRIQQCIEKLRRADGYLYGEMTVNATMQSYHQYDCVRNIFDPFIKSDAPFERLKSLKSGIWSGNSNTAVQWESHSASIAGNCARYPISGVIVPRNTTDDTTSTRNISVYFKTRHPHVPDEINNTQTRFHMGLLWINAPENFNGTAFLLGRKIKDNIVTPRPYRPTKNPHEDKWTIMMNDSEHPTPRPYRPTFTPHGKKWTLMMNDSEHPTPRPYRPTFTLHEDKWTAMMNDSEHPTPRPPGFTHHSTMSTEKSIDIPFKKGDSIPEVFAEPDQNGDVNIKQFLGGRKVNQAVKRTSGVWIVKDQTISPAPRKRRQAVRPTYVPELSCDENMPEGFRCLRDLDIISPDAVLRLVSNVAAVGVLSFAPLEDGETAEDAFADTSKVQNLVLTSVGTGSTTDQRMQIGFTKYTYHVMTTEGEEKVWKLKEMLKIKSIDGFTGNFTDLKEIAADSNSMEFATFIARIEDNAQWPMLQMSGYYNDDLVLKYRATPASQWAEKQPMNQTFEFAATGELKLKLEKDFTLGHQIKFQFSAAAFNATLFVHLKKRLILTKPVSYSLPAVPFDLRNYDGFPVSAVVEQLYPDYSPYLWKSITGLAVVSVTKNYRIGVWQFRCSTCKTWQYVSLRLNGVPQPKGRKRRSLEIGKTRRARQASAAGCEKLEQKVLFLSPGTKIRYLPSRSDYFWSKDEANVNTDITLSLYRVYRSEYSTDPSQVNISGQLDTNGWALITGTKESSCVRQEGDDPVYNLTKLLSPEEESFVMERMGCDRGRSSQKVRDACGICGGNGKSCVDCSGTINGTAKEDGCGYCFGGSTGRSPTQKNCKHDCQNKEYVDDCGYCHRKGDKIINIRDCAGQCRGLAAYDDCGACRSFFGRGNLTDASTPTEKIRDECGVCGGDGSSCQGCDGEYDSGKVLDKCGNCLLPTDVNFNQKCENIYYINGFTPSVVVLPMRSISFKIYGYFNNHNTASCSLHPLGSSSSESIKLPESKITRFTYGSRVKMSADTVHEVTTFLKKSGFPEGTTFSRWNVSCMSGSDKATADKPLIVRSLNPWSIASIEPPFAPVGKGSVDVVITGAKFPSNEDLVCAASHQVFATSFTTKTDILSLISLFQTDKLMMVGATVLESSQVQCALPNVTKAAKITLHVLTKRGAESMSASTIGRYVSGGVTFEYRDKRPEVKEARLTNDLEYIQIEFDTDVKFVKFSKIPETFCDNILEGKPTILGSSPQCYLYRSNSLLIRPGRNPTSPTARTATIGTITLREGAVVGRDSGGATELFQETTVNIQAPKDPLTPAVELWGKPSYEPCEDVFLGVRTRGVGTWDFDYKWSVEIQEKPKLNDEEDIVEYLQKETTGLSWKLISFNNYKGSLQLGANYTIRVSVENDFGKTSENKTIRFMIKEHWSGLQLDLYPPRTGIVESTKTFSIKARAMFLKPRCADDTDSEYNILNANSVNKMDIKYSWKAEKLNSTGVKLANDDKSTLRVKKDTLTPGRYKFTVTASLSESGVENKSASMSSIIEVKGGPLLAHISGPKARVVQSDQIMTLDGSKSRDPNGGNLTYTWKCEKLATGSPCKIFPQENENSNSSATWKSADTIFSSNQTGGVLNFPADRFEPRLLANITLIVQSGDRTASKSVQIQIQDASDLPSIQIIQRNEFGYEAFPVGNKLRVPAAIIGNGNKTWTMILTWKCLEEEGFAYVDLETVNATRLQAVKEVANDRRPAVFSLVLKRNALLPSSTYKFQIRAQADPEVHTQEDGNTKSIYAEIEVKTAPLPTGGELIVSPTNGTVLKTKFKLKAEKWNVADDGQELKYRFAYKSTRKGQNERMSFLGAYSSLQEIETYLPAGPEMKEYLLPIVVMIRIGENDINVQQKTINVLVRPVKTEGADTEIDDTILEDMTTEAAEALVSGDQEYAVSKILLVGKSVKSNEKKKEMRNLADAAIKKYKTYIPTTTRDASSQLSGVVDLLSTFSGDVEVAQESKKIAIDMSENSLNLMRGRTLSSRRRREVEEDTTEDFDPELFNIILALYDVLLQIPENNKTLIAERKENFKRHTELIMEEYCIAVQYGETLQTVESVLSEIGVQKVEMEYDGVYGKSQIFELANDIEMQYSNWDCDPTSTELCPGACISFGSYRGDVMHSYGTQPGTQLKRITPVAAFFIRNPSDGLDASSEANTTDIAGMLTIKFNVTTSQEKMVQCRVLNAASLWTNETCRTVITGTEVTCECNEVSGYFAVFSTPDVEVSTTNSMMPPSETDPLITTLKMESVPPIWESNCAEPNIFSKNCNKTCAAIKCPMNRKGYCKLCHCECVCPYVVEGKCTFEPGEEDERNDTGMTTAAIVGLTIGLVVLSLALVAMVYMYVKKATDRRVSPNASLVEVDPPNPPSYEVTEFAKKEVSDEEVDEEAGTSTKKENEYTAEPLIPNTVVDEPPPGYTEKPEDVVIEV